MVIAWYLWVILTLLSIIPALIVATIFIVKIEQVKGEQSRLIIDINALKGDASKCGNEVIAFDGRLKQVFAEANQANTKLINLEESFKALANKWNSREREWKKEEKTTKQKEEEEPVIQPDPFPQIDMFQPVPSAPVNTRRFGQMPR